MARASDLTPEQRTEIILAMLRREEPTSILARRHGISEQTLNRWREEFVAGGKAQLSSGKKQRRIQEKDVAALEAAVEERDQVIGELTIANRILKKNGQSLPLMKGFGKK
jgi:transposase